MSNIADARTVAMALPEAAEQDHHGMTSFRVRGRIFATVPDDNHIRVMLDESEIRAVVAENAAACAEFYWGKRLSCVVVMLAAATPGLLRELLTEAWLGKAPASLARELR